MNISHRLVVDDLLKAFVEGELLPGTDVTPDAFWRALETILADVTPTNVGLLRRRDELQEKIDAWWRERRGKAYDVAEATRFLQSIGYLLPEPADFVIGTKDVDPEIARLAGPQLV